MTELYDKFYGLLPEAIIAVKEDRIIYYNEAAAKLGATAESRFRDFTGFTGAASPDSDAAGENRTSGIFSLDDSLYAARAYDIDDARIIFLSSTEMPEISVSSNLLFTVTELIKSQLSVLKMAADLLLPLNWSELVESDPEYEKKYYSMFYHSYYSMVRTVTHITDLYEDFGDAFVSDFAYFDAVSVFSELVNTVNIMFAKSGPRISFSSGEEWIEARGNRTRLEQAVLNLLSNSIKYAGSSGKITVSVKSRGKFLIISVSDDGPGISGASMHSVWHKYMAGNDTDDSRQGAGFGLALVKKIAEAHGGGSYIELPGKNRDFEEDEEPRGICFTLSLPIATSDSKLKDWVFTPNDGDMMRILAELSDVLPCDSYSVEFFD